MTLVHSYDLTASVGGEDALASALSDLAQAVKGIEGSLGAKVLRDRKEGQRFLFLEFWRDEEARKAAGSQLPKEVMGRIMGAVTGPLKMAGFDEIASS
jgi:quinol monooxygenase YgiN